MNLPAWVLEAIRTFEPRATCEVEIVLRFDVYKTGVTRLRIGESTTVKPTQK